MSDDALKSDLWPCPCCATRLLTETGAYEICPCCGWEDDPLQTAEPDFTGGANALSLNAAQAAWQQRLLAGEDDRAMQDERNKSADQAD